MADQAGSAANQPDPPLTDEDYERAKNDMPEKVEESAPGQAPSSSHHGRRPASETGTAGGGTAAWSLS